MKIYMPKHCTDSQYRRAVKSMRNGDTVVVYDKKQRERILKEISLNNQEKEEKLSVRFEGVDDL